MMWGQSGAQIPSLYAHIVMEQGKQNTVPVEVESLYGDFFKISLRNYNFVLDFFLYW